MRRVGVQCIGWSGVHAEVRGSVHAVVGGACGGSGVHADGWGCMRRVGGACFSQSTTGFTRVMMSSLTCTFGCYGLECMTSQCGKSNCFLCHDCHTVVRSRRFFPFFYSQKDEVRHSFKS